MPESTRDKASATEVLATVGLSGAGEPKQEDDVNNPATGIGSEPPVPRSHLAEQVCPLLAIGRFGAGSVGVYSLLYATYWGS